MLLNWVAMALPFLSHQLAAPLLPAAMIASPPSFFPAAVSIPHGFRSFFPMPCPSSACPCLVRASQEPLDLTEENVESVLVEARTELLQLFDTSVGITGMAELAELDGPFLKLRLKGRFWHERSIVLARLANFLQKRIPEISGVEIEDEAQLDDSPESF